MHAFLRKTRSLFIAALFGMAILACKDEPNPVITTALNLETTSLGRVLTGDGGRTLYMFAPDADGNANCSGNCLTNWPIYYQEILTLGNGLTQSDFTTITRADGAKQTAFKGWPLYYFKNDAKAGDVTGENVGNVWMVAKPTYTVLVASRQLTGQDGKLYTFDAKEGTGNSLFLTDNLGRTLYAFAPDKKNKNTYTKADLSNNPVWPLFEGTINEVPSTLNKADFSTITVFGRTQVTYKGWPLYYFGNDQSVRGSTKGVSVPRPGVWPVVYKTSPNAPES
jgi:predicted lipoprotein with Yx(FWY)xxD motif